MANGNVLNMKLGKPTSNTTRLCKLLTVAIVVVWPSVNTLANPVSRATALRAATTELPRFFAGEWKLHDEFVLYDVDLQPAAYAFVFSREDLIKEAVLELPDGLVPKKRPVRDITRPDTAAGQEDPDKQQFSTIFISARDSEPPVIRCFRGIPPRQDTEERALALAGETMPQNDVSPVIRHLMLGFFDEAVAIISEDDPDDALVADLRGNRTFPLAEVRERAAAISNAMEPDPERISLSRQAWRKYKTAGRIDGAPLLQSTGGSQ